MLKRMSIRLRLTVLSVLLLTVCCVGLTVILNISANNMADVIEATPLSPAATVGEENQNNAENSSLIKSTATSEDSQVARKDFLHQSILYMVFVVLLGGGLTYLISGSALKPLHNLSMQMKNRTVHNLSEALEIPLSQDEIADLTCSFNEMSQKLDTAFLMQKNFSQSAAHELRTPLAVVKTKLDVFKKKPSHTKEEYDKLLEVISTHTSRLSNLVKDLLELTNTDALEYNHTLNVKLLFREVADELSTLAEEKNVTITLTGNDHIVHGNNSLLRRAFYNLVENAIKYNYENGKVDIVLSAEDIHTKIEIRDTGIGIPIELKELVFEPFFRVDKSRSRQMGGAGLGLSIVKSIIDNHGGKISVEENTPSGTIFTITI